MPYIEGQDRGQMMLLPESIDDYVGQESETRLIEAFVEGLNVQAMGFTYFLTRGHDNVSAEAALVFCAYNFKRALNFMGFKEIMLRLQRV